MKKSVEINGEWTLSFRDEQQKLDSETDAEKMAKVMENAGTVEVLELRGNTVGVGAGQRLAHALEFHPELKRALWSDLFTGRLKEEIPPILRSLCGAMIKCGTRLVELDLSDNAFGPIAAKELKEFLESSSAYSLKVLKLNNNGLGAGGKIIGKALITCHANAQREGQNFRLKTFIAGRNRLEDPGAVALAKAFQVLGSLEEIVMYQDGIRAKGIEALSESFLYNPSLKIINLSDNTFTVNGARAMAKVVRDLMNLEVLNFGDCLCRDKGALAIISNISLPFHSRLKEINLSGNELSPRVVEIILDKVSQGLHLKSLVLHTNNMGARFVQVKSKCDKYDFIDLGEESDDQGTLDEDEESDDYQELYSEESHFSYSNNESGDEQVEDGNTTHDVTINKSLESDSCQTVISFRNQRWNSEEDVGTVTQALLSQKFLKVLDLRENYIGIGACRRIAEVLRERMQMNMQSLEEVNLSQNGTIAEGMIELVHAFRSNPELKVIILSGNTLNVDGAIAVAEMLSSLRLLEVLDLSSCTCHERGIIAVATNLSSSTHLRLRVLDFSSNALGADAIQRIVRVFASGGFHLERLSLHSNNIGHRFDELREEFSHLQFLDLGSESTDQGSSMEEIAFIDSFERESWNKSDDEYTKNLNNILVNELARPNMNSIILFIKKPSIPMLDVLLSHMKTFVETLHADLCGRTQEMTAALLCSFCTLLSLESPNKQALKEKIMTLTDAILIEAAKVKRRPVSATESICNQLLAFAGAVKSEVPQTLIDISSVIFLLGSMVKLGHFRDLYPTIAFSLDAMKRTYPDESVEIDRLMQAMSSQ
ncbi:leucine Rich Repeat family protein [Loa loa]|uniref:Leucine Rich Repeat family protein n=1 Tax=Loa loa TaxID=7209 RepID=A0A1I7VKA4_LOALO|nr:leucine Rich Repeat family protein [Loa loa]EJD74672.1 leucine Rich Repeat family protein [Loa loa]